MATANPSSRGSLSMDKAAFLLIRIKRAFLRKRNKGRSHVEKPPSKKKPPLLRARTLPAIICPSLNILQAQLEANGPTAPHKDEPAEPPDHKPRRHFSGSGPRSGDREKLYLDPEFEPCRSPLGSPRTSVTSVTSGTSTLSQPSFGRESTRQKYESTKASLAKLAKLLTSKDKPCNNKVLQQFPSIIPNIEVTPLRRSGSVDSLMDANLYPFDASDISNCSSMACLAPSVSTINLSPANLSPTGSLVVPTGDGRGIPTSPSVPAKLEAHRRGDIPSSPSVPNKLAKGLSGQCLESPEVLLEGLPLSKAERKRLEKLNKINIDLQALFVSVEHEHLERARSILTTTDVNVNCVNSDGFTPLDIAVMILDISMSKLLQSYGARESTRFRTKESKFAQLLSLVKEAERCVEDLTSCVLSAATSGSLSMALLKEKEKQLSLWRRRQQLLRRMKSGYEKIRLPNPPSSVHLEVVGIKSLRVKFTEDETSRYPETVVTKYKVEWSVRSDFHPLSGSREILNLQRLEVILSELIQGVPYYVRVAAGNLKGYSAYTPAEPPFAAPSSWMDVEGKRSRASGRLCQLDCVFHKVIFSRPPCSSEFKDLLFGHTLETPQQQRRQVRKSIKNLFTPTPKFQKTMKRGVYIACLMYSEHRVLVSTEDTLPIMEVDENCPSCLHNDFHWLMKVACTWEDTKALRVEMEKSQSSSAVHFRSKLLQAAEMMQTALGVQDLGQFYFKPIKDSYDTTVVCTVKYVADAKSLNSLSVRWVPLAKLQRKLSINSDACQDVSSVNSLLLSATQAMMAYNHMSRIPLPRGLYAAYVKISSSVDLIRVLVPKKAPNVLPYYRVRENPHVSKEEWGWLKSQGPSSSPTPAQLKFQKSLSSACRNLVTLLEVPSDQTGEHRIYDSEVIELNPDVSLVLILPPVDSVCSAPGQKDDVTERADCVLLPIQIFEMIHMNTYQHTFISRYSRISSILEMDTIVAKHVHRQAFSTSELASAKSRLRQLQEFQSQVDSTWRSMRWLMDVLNFAREKQPPGGILLERILLDPVDSAPGTPQHSPQQSPPVRHHTLQVPGEHLVPCAKSGGVDVMVSIRITGSSSSFSLTDASTGDDAPNNTEMRRCASTSGLLQASGGGTENIRQLPPCTLKLLDDQTKAYSVERLSVTYTGDGSGSDFDTTPINDDEESDKIINQVAEAGEDQENTLSHDDIVIHVMPGSKSGVSLSSNDVTNPDADEFEDDIDDYSEQNIVVKELLHVPYGLVSGLSVEDEDDEAEDCGLQFKALESRAEDEYDVISHLLSECDTMPDDCSVPENVLRVSFGDEKVVRLQVDPEVSARDIANSVAQQLDILESSLCLSIVVESAETRLSDSFQPLKLQNPWTKGKLVVKKMVD